MRINKLILLTVALLFACGQSFASQITVQYTGTYTGSWFGNFAPDNSVPPDGGLSSGQFPSAPFRLTFSFDTSLAAPGFFDQQNLATANSGYPITSSPSVGSASFIGSTGPFGGCCNAFAGQFSAFDRASNGSTTQYADSVYFTRYTGLTWLSPTIQMTAYSPKIPGSILTSFEITDGLTGNGFVSVSILDTFLGGLSEQFDLVPTTLSVSADPPTGSVPEPSTWAMLLLGFAGIGFIGYRQRKSRAA